MKDCNAVMEKYLSLDKGERVPLGITLHLLCCASCRNQVRLLAKAEKAASASTMQQAPLDDQTILSVLGRVSAQKESQKNPISFSKWIGWGLIMIVALMISSLSVRTNSDHRLIVYTYVELAAIITVYCAFFVKSNMDFFVKLMNTKLSPRG